MANTLDSIIDYLADAVVKDSNGDAELNDLKLKLDTTAAAGTTDGDLYAVIQSLGIESDVVDSSSDVIVKKMLTNILKALSAENRLVTKTETISVPSTTGTLIRRGEGLTLNAGVWVITASVAFPANNTGYRRVGIGDTESAYSASRNSSANTGGYETHVFSGVTVAPTVTTTYYSYIQHNVGSTLSNVAVHWRAVRIA